MYSKVDKSFAIDKLMGFQGLQLISVAPSNTWLWLLSIDPKK
jgi:hypothetical protein